MSLLFHKGAPRGREILDIGKKVDKDIFLLHL
jgi:hypothetical protein